MLVVLIMMAVLLTLGWYLIDELHDSLKNNLIYFKKEQIHHNNSYFLSHLTPQQLTALTCLINPLTTLQLRQMSNLWWHQHACTLQSSQRKLQWIVEDLGHDPCALVGSNHRQIKAHYYRITIRNCNQEDIDCQMMQSTYVYGDNDQSTCSSMLRTIQAGQQMIRDVSD